MAAMRVQAVRSKRALVLLAAAALALNASDLFVGGPAMGSRRGVSLRASVEDYPELSRVEDLIYDSCAIKEDEQEMECLRVWDKLRTFHKESAIECNLDDMRCVVLDILDRLCSGIHAKDGLILLNKVSAAVLSFRQQFENWDDAFSAVDTDHSGAIDMEELVAAMKKMGADMTDNEVRMVFKAADANGDGEISSEEFSDFLTAAVFAEEPLRNLQVDSLPTKQPDMNDYLRWSTSGRVGSWAGLAGLARSGR